MRKHNFFRKAALGTGLTALFLLVRCTVAERDYSQLGFDDNGGSGGAGTSGASGGGAGGSSAGQGGSGGSGGSGGQDGGTPPIEPVPCDTISSDAGSNDAGNRDAGSNDAGSDAGRPAAVCECIDGFLRAVDADGDGEGTRACTAAPGLDCDDGDGTITHNACGGCTDLPNEVGEDCLDCGAYACKGPDGLTCRSKLDPVEDPDCRCEGGVIVARDTDGDREGTRLCEQNPGNDCNDGDETFVTNQCGGCDTLPGTVGGACNQCGTYTCSGAALVCTPKTGAAGRRCVDSNTRQSCVGTGFWDTPVDCTNVCYQGNCEICIPGTFRCFNYAAGDLIQECVTNARLDSSSTGIGWSDSVSCATTQQCNVANGTCVGSLLLPRDQTFEISPLLQPGGLPWHDVLNTASDSDYG